MWLFDIISSLFLSLYGSDLYVPLFISNLFDFLNLNLLCFCFLIPHVSVQVEVLLEILMQHFPQVLGYALNATLMGVYHRRFAEWVGIQLCRGVDDTLRMLLEIIVGRYAVFIVRHHVKQVVIALERFLLAVLLQDDEVAAHFRVGILREKVVWQADCRNHIGMTEHHEPCRTVVLGVQHALRGDERHQSAIPYRVECLDKEVVVYALGTDCLHPFLCVV